MRFLNLLWWYLSVYLATILRIISWSVVNPEYYFINGNILTSFSVQLKFNTDPVTQPDTTNADFSLPPSLPPSISPSPFIVLVIWRTENVSHWNLLRTKLEKLYGWKGGKSVRRKNYRNSIDFIALRSIPFQHLWWTRKFPLPSPPDHKNAKWYFILYCQILSSYSYRVACFVSLRNIIILKKMA